MRSNTLKQMERKRERIRLKIYKRRKIGRSRAGNIVLYLVLIMLGVVFAFPIFFMVNNAFKPIHELMQFPPLIMVRNPTFDSFRMLAMLMNQTLVPMSRYMFNTFMFVIVGTFGQLIIGCMAAYPLAKFDFAGDKAINQLLVIALLFTTTILVVPQFLIMNFLGIIDTYLAIILPGLGTTLGVYLMRNFMVSVPSSLIEAAYVDGAGDFYILWRIIIPAVKPAVITMFILSFSAFWGVSGTGVLYTETLKPFAAALSQITTGALVRVGPSMVASLILFVIPLALFIFMQTRMVETMASSGLKE